MLRSIIQRVRNRLRGKGKDKEKSSVERQERKKKEALRPKPAEFEVVHPSLRRKPETRRKRPKRAGRTPREKPSPPEIRTGPHTTSKPRRATRPRTGSRAGDSWDLSRFQVPPDPDRTRFHDLDIPECVMHAVADLGFRYCTPIQAAILPRALTGTDAAGRAQTGTGKTAAFLTTILTHLTRTPAPGKRRHRGTPRSLILAPTRELALQIENDSRALAKYTPAKIIAIFGGMDYEKQKKTLEREIIDIMVATPGRLLDFHRQNLIHLGKVEILVIDEADRMLDMGFIPDVRRIIHHTPPCEQRQTMLFSATLTPEVTRLASRWTRNPVSVEIDPEQVAVETVDQRIYIITKDQKFALLYNLITRQDLQRVLVFCNRRDQSRRLFEKLEAHGVCCALLSGDITQKKRIRTLEGFRTGRIRVLVATDVASRGLHVEDISHVVNYTMPYEPEDYVHRIGRTGRAGASGTSVSFASEEDGFEIPAIEEYIGMKLICVHPESELLTRPPRPERRARRDVRPGRARSGERGGERRRRRRPPPGERARKGGTRNGNREREGGPPANG